MIIEAVPERTWALIESALAPRRFHSDSSCYLYAVAAHAALRGTGARFCAGGAFLWTSLITGWGLAVDPAGRQYFLTCDATVDEEDDGSYCGHCWVELGTFEPTVIDLMTGYVGPAKDVSKPVIYHHRPTLAQSIRRYHVDALRDAAKAARADTSFVAEVRKLAGIS
jgi:hypothetical protein